MADVFISYSQKHPEPTEELASDLVRAGYAYWFDSRLLPADVFWRVIMKRITDAKAVIVIWSPPALETEWVYGEAKLAHKQGKLVCVRTGEVDPDYVPIPFNGYNVSPVVDRQRIFEALKALGVPGGGTGGFAAPPDDPAAAVALAPALVAADRGASEAERAFEYIKASDDPDDFEMYLKRYGEEHEFFAHLARKKIKILLAGKPAGIVVPVPAEIVPIRAASPAVEAEIAAAASDVVLRLDPGLHTALIRRISVSADGRRMATASDDKTVRLWSQPDGPLVRTFRPAIGDGNDGKVYAVALAPDVSWLAAGGWDYTWATKKQMFISIFDTVTGAITARLGPMPEVILDLEISPDGRRLAAGLGGSNGIRVWSRTPSPRSAERVRGEGEFSLAFEDRDYGGDVYGLAFAADGRLATTSDDGYVRLYGATGQRLAKAKAPGGSEPYGIAVSPDGARLAVGYHGTTRVDVLDAATLAPLDAADTTGVANGNLMSVAWINGGARLAAAGRFEDKGTGPILVWSDAGRGGRSAWPGPAQTVMDLAALPGGGLAYGAGDPAFGTLDAAGRPTLTRPSALPEMRNKLRQHFLSAPDGRRLRFGLDQGSAAPVLLDLVGPSVTPSPTAPPGLAPADTASLPIEGWEDTTAPTLDGAALPLEPYERARSLAIAPGGTAFVLGTEWSLRRFDVTTSDGGLFGGKKKHVATQKWEKPVPGVVWGVHLARDGRLVIAAYADGTIRWHRADNGDELLACFIPVTREGGETRATGWILWTPKGFYTCSEGADDLIGWHVNRGPDQAADFYPAHTFSSTFKRPDIVAKALDGV